MSQALEHRIYKYIQYIFGKRQGSWLVWCDPRNEWGPLLESVASAKVSREGFPLFSVNERTARAFGSPLWRRRLHEQIATQHSFVLHVITTKDDLGWLWAQALRAEEMYTMSLRDQLGIWGWRSQNIHTSNEELAHLARQYLDRDPADWGGGGLQPDPMKLLPLLMGAIDKPDDEIILKLTIDAAGLPPYDDQNIERWRTYALASLLVTQAHEAAGILENHELIIAPDKRKYARELLERLLDSVQLSKGLPERILEADRVLVLSNYLQRVGPECEPFLSYTAERALFAQTCTMLAEKRGRELLETVALMHDIFEKHAQGFWGDQSSAKIQSRALPWGELARLSRAAQQLLEAAPSKAWGRPADVIIWYVTVGWKVDRAGDELLRLVQRPTTEFLNLLTPLRDAYSHRWEEYMVQWSDLWSNAGCPVPELPSQGSWLKEQLGKSSQPTAVLVIDALRYDLGAALKEHVNAREGTERARLTPARTALPTITALGMGMALPIDEDELYADLANGAWQLHQNDNPLNLSIAEERREWLRTHLNVLQDALLPFAEAEKGSIPASDNKHHLLFLFDATIDKLGHDDELEPQGSGAIQARYSNVIALLHQRGWTRILIVTDHGFIQRPGTQENVVPPPLPDRWYSSRRAIAYPAQVELEGPQGLAPGGAWRIVFPYGATCFRTYGGSVFVHGGASLQEWIVPCLTIEWPSKAKPVEVGIQPVAQILSLRPKITLEVRREQLFTSDDVLARQVDLRLRNVQNQDILFSSASVLITPDQEPIAVLVNLVEGVEAERGTPLVIEMWDMLTGKILDSQPTVLMIPIENW